MSGSSATQLVGAYLASKGLPMTGENIRRALEMNASNPGMIKGLVNEAPPPPDGPPSARGGASTTSNARGSAPDALASRMHQQLPTPPIPPQPQQSFSEPQGSASDSGGGSGILSTIAQAILGGGAAGGLAHLFASGRPSASSGGMPIPEIAMPMPGSDPRLTASQPALPPPAQVPPPAQMAPPAQVGGPAQMPQISDKNMVGSGLQPIGPPQPGRMQPGPSTEIPMPPMPQGAAAASDAATRAPVSIVPRVAGADAADLGGHMDWGRILGDVAKTVGRR